MQKIEDFVTEWFLPNGWRKIAKHLQLRSETTGEKISIVVGELIVLTIGVIAIYLILR